MQEYEERASALKQECVYFEVDEPQFVVLTEVVEEITRYGTRMVVCA